jgi:hypothetical protein
VVVIRWVRAVCLAATAVGSLWTAPVVAAQSPSLDSARDLYAAASYDEALSVLGRLRSSAQGADVGRIEYYRALCLLAIGRPEEAATAIEVAVTAEPFAHPSDTETSPHVRAAFRDVRRRLLPAIVDQKYTEARAAFDRKDDSAAQRFSEVVALMNDPDLQDVAREPGFAQMRALAADYVVLSVERGRPQ